MLCEAAVMAEAGQLFETSEMKQRAEVEVGVLCEAAEMKLRMKLKQ